MSNQNDVNEPKKPVPAGSGVFGRRNEQFSLEDAGNTAQSEQEVLRTAQQILQPKSVPAPPTRAKQARGGMVVFFNFCMSCLVLLVLAVCVSAYFGRISFYSDGNLAKARTVSIAQGSSLSAIADKLEAAGVIDSNLIFRLGVRASKAAGDLKPGEFAFKPKMSMYEVMQTIRSGKGVVYKVSLPEGLTTYQIFQRLAADENLEGELPSILPEEGSLMPDTYPYQKGTTRQDVINLMKRSQDRFLEEVWARRIEGLPINSPRELVTLASIVEKETGKADERPHVASVFINRLNKGMKLQSDPTIIYGIFGGQGKPKERPIYKSDIKTPTPYNTYTIPALPPGPIANPGRASLEAVANPSRTDDLFFVASGDGGHVFAKTLKEHNANVKRWRSIEKSQANQ
ncbi:MAG: endolytic transglycosylase MltG [Nitratireductor sp.]